MATLLITNLTASDIHMTEFYTTLRASSTLTVTRPVSTLPTLKSLQAGLAAGTMSLSVTLDANESASGLASPPNVIGADDIAEIASTALLSPELVIRKAVTAGGGGSADDVTVYAANALPFKFRIIDAWCYLSAGNAGGRTITIRDEAAGAGTAAGTLDATNLGRVEIVPTSNASTVYTPGATKGVFLRRSDSAIAGEVFIKIRRES